MFLYAWVYYPIVQGHGGDFLAMLSHRQEDRGFWDGHGIGYGPVFALIDLALRPLPDLPAMRVMYIINMLLLGATFALLVGMCLRGQRQGPAVMVTFALWANYYPLIQLIRQNNIEITELFFLCCAYFLLTRRREWGAGLFFGLAAATKIVPLALLPYLAWRRRWRALGMAILTVVAMTGIVCALKGEDIVALARAVRQLGGKSWPNEWNNNQAFSGFFFRLFSAPDFSTLETAVYPTVLHPQLAAWLTTIASAALLGAVAVLFLRRCGWWPRPALNPMVEILELNIILLTVLLCLSHSHTHYFGLVFPLYPLTQYYAPEKCLSPASARLLAIGYLLLGLLIPLRILDPLTRLAVPLSTIEISKLCSLPMIGAILTLIALLQIHRTVLAAPAP
jgi:hypothetical protein